MTHTGRAGAWWDSVGLAIAALALYLSLAQEALHGLDVHVHVFFLTQGHLEHPFHLLYLKLMGGAWPALRELGLGPHAALRLMSALGTALGVLCAHRAALLLTASRAQAAAVATACAVPAAVVFFATVPEIHGVFMAFAGAAWWALGALARRRTWLAAAVLGVATGLAASVHATGHLLGAAAVALWWSLGPGVPWRSALRLAVVAGIVHVTVTVAVASGLHGGGIATPFGGQLGFLDRQVAVLRAAYLLPMLWDEWVVAFLPLSLACVVAALRPSTRRLGLVTCATLAAYLAVSLVLLHGLYERGAYMLPLVLPFGLCAVRATGTRTTFAACALALAWAVLEVRAHDHVDRAEWVAGFVEIAAVERPALICRDVPEQEQITRAAPDVPFLRVDSLLDAVQREGKTYDDVCGQFDALFALYAGQGRSVLITRPAHAVMVSSIDTVLRRFATEHLAARYRLEPVERGGFAALRVIPR